ncbi:MAG TPA: S-methyl-5'-thioadenosine phosphorylase [SAR202 cluster bacterium]|jgi:5'-methylthioadenosine phosphorylase|nr:S-methyl-5'-thioadenosine phosphorylase [SAR202 cluster bacterium]|tara:strand:- start:11078 stop:11941 length:864 start_codon:yes stop_codon:yes gene_type:complete
MIEAAFIGGSGVYELEDLRDIETIEIITPFGNTSAAVTLGSIGHKRVAFIPRHGTDHSLSPSEVPYKANIYALKALGVRKVISVSAVGSLNEAIKPLDIVIPDQLIDRTKSREDTFFGDGLVAHISFANPFCKNLSSMIDSFCESLAIDRHLSGTYLAIEGPQFSTKAESNLYRKWGCDIIGMTAIPEAKLAREAEMCYATIAVVTDYDCWKEDQEEVTASMVINNLKQNVETSKKLISKIAGNINTLGDECLCNASLRDALVTQRILDNQKIAKKLGVLLQKYLPA